MDAGHRPQTLVLSFFGGLVHGRDVPPIPTSTFLRLLGGLGVAEAAARATLARMSSRGLLDRVQDGRVARYRLTPSAASMIGKAAERVSSVAPFEHPEGQWTLLSYSMPESRRDLRQRVRATLTWAGFGGLRDGLWIAPGVVDVGAVLTDAGLSEVAGLGEWFAATPLPGVRPETFIHRAWRVEQIQERHERFVQAWSPGPRGVDPLGELTLLGADWLQLLRTDPGLPARHLPVDWPAARSAAVYRRCHDSLVPAARAALDADLD
ncbi:PaaX family transcriptional regulator C-terminal domain-containing protein [Actinomycetes bacterium KLBMP 9759]